MTTANDVRKAHKILDDLFKGKMVLDEEREFLRNALPELPKQKTLEEIHADIHGAWVWAKSNEWADDAFVEMETWLQELRSQVKGLIDTEPAHPEFLETEADYENAPEGTIVVGKNYYPWTKTQSSWLAYGAQSRNDFEMRACRRYVLRWGDK